MGDEKILREIGIRIATRRKEIGMTQETLAEKMDVSVQMISNLENGKKGIRPENMLKLCHVLSVSADFILRGKGSSEELSDMAKRISNLPPEKRKLIEDLVRSWE